MEKKGPCVCFIFQLLFLVARTRLDLEFEGKIIFL